MANLYKTTIDIDNKNSSHTQIIDLVEQNSKVLDVGCAWGDIGAYLAENKQCEVVGLDYLEEHVEYSKTRNTYKDVFQIDLNNFDNQLSEYDSYFDYIVVADVLEHLYNPETVLNKLKCLLNDNGKILISLPNITHGSIKLSLLKGEFDYFDYGILDRTHIRFFNLKNIIELCNNASLEIADLSRIFATTDFIVPKVNLSEFPREIVDFALKNDEFFTLQFIFAVKNSKDKMDDLKLKNSAWLSNKNLEPIIEKYKNLQLQQEKRTIRSFFKQIEQIIRKNIIKKAIK